MKAIRTKLKLATALTSMALVNGGIDNVFGQSVPSVSTYATGLTNPRGLAFGPDGNLYVAEAGTGGSQTPADIDPSCPVMVNVFSPFTAGYSGRVTRVLADGTTETVADNLPSMTDVTGVSLGPTDVAFVGGTLYVLIEMGGCSHALPEDLPAILRVNPDGSTTSVANLNAWLAANPPHFIKDTNPATTDLEPDGVFHSMFAAGRYLYVVETNRGMLLRVDPKKGVIELAYDMSTDNAEHNPIVLTRHRPCSTWAPSAMTAGRRSSRCSTRISRAIRCGSTRPIRSSAWPGAATGCTASRSSRPTSSGPPTTRISSPSIP